MEGLELEGSRARANTKEDKDKEYKYTYDRFIQKTITNLMLMFSHPQQLPSNAKKTKLKHPYTSYNVFFRLEHAYILQSTEGAVDEEILSSLDPHHSDPVEFPRPAKYAHLVLPPYWYSSLHSDAVEKKRRHRKRHGRLDMVTLSKTISESWKVADKGELDYCIKLAQIASKFYGYPEYILQRNGRCTSKRSTEEGDADIGAEEGDADTGAGDATGRDLGDVEGAEVNNENCDIDPSQRTNGNQKQIAQGVEQEPDPDARTIEAMNENQRTRNMTNNEDVRFSGLHPEGIPLETMNFFRSRSGTEIMAAAKSRIDAIARRRSQTRMEMMVADEALDINRFVRLHSSNEGDGNGLSSQYRDHGFPNLLAPLQNKNADNSFLLRYGHPPVASGLSLLRAQFLLSEARQAARNSSMVSAIHPAVPYQSGMYTPQAMLRAMDASYTTSLTLGLGLPGGSLLNADSTMDSSNTAPTSGIPGDNSLANNFNAMDSRKPVPDLGIGDNKSPSNHNNARDLPKTVPKLGIHKKTPPNEDIQTPDFFLSAILSSDVQDHQKISESDNPICLFIPSDLKVLDPVHNFPRGHCIKIIEKTENDHTPGRVGQVGLRCFYCEETCLPSKRDTIYEHVLSFQTNHLESCPSLPEKMKAKYKTLVQKEYSISKENRPSHAFLRAYYAEAASELGLVDSPNGGLVFGAPQNTSGVPSKRLLSLLEAAGYNGLY